MGIDPQVGEYTFKTKNSADAVKRIVFDNYSKEAFVKEGTVLHNEAGEREYSTPETGTWWNTIQVPTTCMFMLHYIFY